MVLPIEIYQAEDRNIVVSHADSALTTATEIEARIDTTPQIKKLLSASEITNVTATSLTVVIDDGDTSSKMSGDYRMQIKYTAITSGDLIHVDFLPNIVQLKDSIFVTVNLEKDY